MIDYTQPNHNIRLLKKLERVKYEVSDSRNEGDALLVVEGREGTGKTFGSIYAAGYVKKLTSRDIHLFFNLQDLINTAQSTTGKILIWDEPALEALSTDNLKAINRDLIRLLFTNRINRHLYLFNIIDFTKFNNVITIERPKGFIHLYKARPRHACWIRHKKLETLDIIWNKQHRRIYHKLKQFDFDFPEITPQDFNDLDLTINNIPHATYQDYKRMKQEAISKIGKDDKSDQRSKLKLEIKKLKKLIATEPKGLSTLSSRANHYKVDERQLQRWRNLDLNNENDQLEGEGVVFKADDDTNNLFTKVTREEKKTQSPPDLSDNDESDDL